MTAPIHTRPQDAALKFLAPGRNTAGAVLSLIGKIALIPAFTLLLMGLVLTTARQQERQSTAALRAFDPVVFEPLSQAQTLEDRITLLHSRLFALLSVPANEADPAFRKLRADALHLQLDTETTNVNHFFGTNPPIAPLIAARLREAFTAYADQVREIIHAAAADKRDDTSLTAADAKFDNLRIALDALVQSLAQRREALATEAVNQSVANQTRLLEIGLGAIMLGVLGSIAIGHVLARPHLRLTAMMNGLVLGDTDLPAPGTDRNDGIGAMARAVETFRATLMAHRQGEVALRRTNVQLDAALNSMQQGMIVWGADHCVQLINKRFFDIVGLPPDCIVPGLTARETIDISMAHGLHPGENPDDIVKLIKVVLAARSATRFEMEMAPGLFVQLAGAPMADGGAVITFEDISEKRQHAAQITFMARHDALTGLPNRTLFQEHLEALLAVKSGQSEPSMPFGVLCLDLDHFKEVNDTIGHPAGDELLRLVAKRLRSCVRDGDMIARLGGDEFAVVVASPTGGPTVASLLATRIIDSISAPYDVQGNQIVIGTSIGIALSEPGVSGADMLKQADVALYRAKEERGIFAFFEPGMDERLRARRSMEADLRLALHRDEFELHYQPLYNLAEDRVTGFEALIRWNSPTRGRVAPNDFIPLAEQTGLIVPIGEWVLRTACAEAAHWPDHVRVAVNLSAIQTKNQHLVALVRETLEQTGLPTRRLELEITETMLLQDTETVITMLHSLHDMGVRVSMDDFGTGYSSLSYLHRFPFDKIKIDRAFVRDLQGPNCIENGSDAPDTVSASAKSAAMIVRAIVGLGNNLGISITAEGVETAQQFEQVRQHGCAEVQGYFISPPRPAAEVADLLRRRHTSLPAVAPQLVA